MKHGELNTIEPDPADSGGDADELHARRVVSIWVAIAVLVILALALGYSLSKRDINTSPPELEDF